MRLSCYDLDQLIHGPRWPGRRLRLLKNLIAVELPTELFPRIGAFVWDSPDDLVVYVVLHGAVVCRQSLEKLNQLCSCSLILLAAGIEFEERTFFELTNAVLGVDVV